MKIDIATWDDLEDVQNLINEFNKSRNLDIIITCFENRAGTYFATVESNKLTMEDAFYLGKQYGLMIEDFKSKGLI